MKITLSKYQRYAAIAAAAAIVIVQILQFEDNGFEGYGWILSFAVAALLAIVGIGPVNGTISASARAAPASPRISAEEIDERRKQWTENAEVLAVEVVERAKAIADQAIETRNKMMDGAKFVNDDGSEHGMNRSLDSFLRDRALMFTLGLVATRRAAGNNMYITQGEYKETEKKVFEAIVKEAIASQVAMGVPLNKDTLLPAVLGELQTIRRCVMSCATLQKDGDADYARPLLEWGEKQGLILPDSSLVEKALARS